MWRGQLESVNGHHGVGAPLPREVCARRELDPLLGPGWPRRDRTKGLLVSPRSRHCSPPVLLLLCRSPCTPHSSPLPCTQPWLAPAAHKPSAQAHPLRNTPGNFKIWPFLKVAWRWHTSLQSPYCWKNFCTDCFFPFINIYIYIRVCVHMYMHIMYIYTHTPWLSNSSLSCTTNS